MLVSFCNAEHLQINVNHHRVRVWGALSVPFNHKNTHILFVNFTVVCGSCQGWISLILLLWKGTLDLIWQLGCRGPLSLTLWRMHS